MRKTDLRNERAYPDANEDRVSVESLEDVALSMDLTRIDLVEERHHDERVEDNCEMLVGNGAHRRITSAVDVK